MAPRGEAFIKKVGKNPLPPTLNGFYQKKNHKWGMRGSPPLNAMGRVFRQKSGRGKPSLR